MGVACKDGCSCGRHNSGARRAAAAVRWARSGPEDRAAQAAVMKAVVTSSEESRRADFAGWIARVEGRLAADEFHDETATGLEEHLDLARRLGVEVVQVATLKRYGLGQLEWLERLAAQGWRCPICLRRVHKFVTDHEHVKGWKDLPPDERKRYFRGVLCVYDNYKVVPSRMTAEEAARMVRYLHRYEERRGS